MTLLLKKPLEEEFISRKRARFTGEFQDCGQEAQRDERLLRRRKLDEIYEQNRTAMEDEIQKNIDCELQQSSKRRKKKSFFETTYDEETVRAMISVALETQKEKLFETFVEQNLEDLAHYEQVINLLFNRHATQNAPLINSYIT